MSTPYATLPSMIGNFATDPRGYAQTAITLPVVTVSQLPTSDPHVVNQVYVSSGAVKVSAG